MYKLDCVMANIRDLGYEVGYSSLTIEKHLLMDKV